MKELNIEEVKSIQLTILKEVHTFCEENNIVYSLYFGTLLGAVRHKGYIPWDDDIDLMMPRPDYERFLKIFNGKNDQYRVQASSIDSEFPYNFAKVEDKQTKMLEDLDLPVDIGVNIDIFPIDAVPESEKEFSNYFKKLKIYRDILAVKIMRKKSGTRSLLKGLLVYVLKTLLKLVSHKKIVATINAEITKYDYKTSKFVMPSCFELNKKKHKLPKTIYEEMINLPFESNQFKAIKEYDSYLKAQYGNYMEFPPEKDRISTHHFKAYSNIA